MAVKVSWSGTTLVVVLGLEDYTNSSISLSKNQQNNSLQTFAAQQEQDSAWK